MSDDNNIKKFTAVDIERYHKGSLSPEEMNALEKAALDDPFLADALEGYAISTVNMNEDLEDLKARLAERTSDKKMVPLFVRRTSFYYMRVAAILILIAGAGWLVYQFTVSSKKPEIAQVPSVENKGTTTNDTVLQNETVGNGTTTNKIGFSDTSITKDRKTSKPIDRSDIQPTIKVEWKSDSTSKVANGLAYQVNDDSKKGKAGNNDKTNKVEEVKPATRDKTEGEVVVSGLGVQRSNKEANLYTPAPRGAIENNDLRSNNFNARVRGKNNEPVPFANITVLNNNTSTYTDANGRFGVYLKDSLATVEVKSVGYENNTAVLRNNVSTDIILSPSRKQLSEVVVTVTKNDEDEKEENKPDAQPVDGWEKYNNYIQNNIVIPADLKASKKGDFVELSFDITKTGRPVHIKVETSLNKDCNHEAIRLLKEGPNWNKGSGKLKIYFK